MSGRKARQFGFSENAAFEKTVGGLRHAIEGLTEIGHYRGEKGFMVLALVMEQTLNKLIKLQNARRSSLTDPDLDEIVRGLPKIQ